MLIPIRCFTCNKVISHLWEDYQSKIQQAFQELDMKDKDRIIKFDEKKRNELKFKTFEGKILDEIGLNKYCCRTIMISSVDLTKKI
jgi:DNA-directed RNA polymerase I, II, and III subunit RPABC5